MSFQSSDERIRTERHGHVMQVIVDNQAKKNAFVPSMMLALSEALTEIHRNDDIWAGVLCAAGDHTTAGLDMPKFFGPSAEKREIPDDLIDPFALRNRCAKPLVSAVQGITFTIGIEMMLACDVVVAADSARFCQMEAKRGIAPFGGAHFRFLTRAGWGNSMYHLFLCDEFDAAEAYRIGLVQEVVPHGQQVDRALEIAQLITKNAPLGIQVTKESALTYTEQGEQAAVDFIPKMQERVLSSEDMMEGIASFMERREAQFKGC